MAGGYGPTQEGLVYLYARAGLKLWALGRHPGAHAGTRQAVQAAVAQDTAAGLQCAAQEIREGPPGFAIRAVLTRPLVRLASRQQHMLAFGQANPTRGVDLTVRRQAGQARVIQFKDKRIQGTRAIGARCPAHGLLGQHITRRRARMTAIEDHHRMSPFGSYLSQQNPQFFVSQVIPTRLAAVPTNQGFVQCIQFKLGKFNRGRFL